MYRKGQVTLIDLLMGGTIFLLLIVLLFTIFEQNKEILKEQDALNEMKEKCVRAINLLVTSQGIPQNWKDLEIGEIKELGLAEKSKKINEEKLVRFSNLASGADYNSVKSLMNLTNYDFDLNFFGVDEVTAGVPAGIGDFWKINIRRIVQYKGSEAFVEITCYKPKE